MSAPHPIAVAARPQSVAHPTDPASPFAAAAAAGAISVTAIRVQPTAGQQWDGAAATMQAGPSGAAAVSPAAASSSSSVASRRRGYWYWQRWPGRNQPFGCFGHVVLLARDHATLFTNVAIILVNGAVFLALVARHVHAAVVAVGVIITAAPLLMLALTTFTEPGIIPRKKLSDYPSNADPVPGNNGPLYPAPTGLLENIEVPLKWCKTCAIWVCNCVGKRNYRYFVGFLTSVLLMDVYILFWSVFLLGWEAARTHDGSFQAAVAAHPLALVEAVIAVVFLCCLGGLCSYHAFLIVNQLTTSEHLKRSRRGPGAPNGGGRGGAGLPAPLSGALAPLEDQHHSNGTGAMHSLALDAQQNETDLEAHRSASHGQHEEHSLPCCFACRQLLCTPVPPSLFDLNSFVLEEEERAVDARQTVSRVHSPYPQQLPTPQPRMLSGVEMQQAQLHQQFALQQQQQHQQQQHQPQHQQSHQQQHQPIHQPHYSPQPHALHAPAQYDGLLSPLPRQDAPLPPLRQSGPLQQRERDSLLLQTRARTQQVEREMAFLEHSDPPAGAAGSVRMHL